MQAAFLSYTCITGSEMLALYANPKHFSWQSGMVMMISGSCCLFPKYYLRREMPVLSDTAVMHYDSMSLPTVFDSLKPGKFKLSQ